MANVVCASCNVASDPASGVCPVCNAPFLGLTLPDRSRWGSLAMAGTITVVSYGLLRASGVESALLAIPMFYGPLVAAYLARDHAVGPAALGGLLGILFIIVATMLADWNAVSAALARLAEVKTAVRVVLVGVPLALFALLPVCLLGAAVGELLGQRRRRLVLSSPT